LKGFDGSTIPSVAAEEATPAGPRSRRVWREVGNFGDRHSTALLALVVFFTGLLGVVWIQSAIAEFVGPITASGHHDFFAFYAAATLVRTDQPQLLYDASVLTHLQRQIFPQPVGYAGYMPFLNPPSAAVLLSPLAALSEQSARLVWLSISLVLGAACVLVLAWGRDRRIRALTALVVVASFPTYQTLVEGQWSFVMLLGCLGALAAGRRGHYYLAGSALALLWLKPPVLGLVLLWLVLTRNWRTAAGMVGAVLAFTVITLPWAGVSSDVNYLGYLLSVSAAHVGGAGAAGQTAWEGALPNMEGLIGLAAAIVGQQHPFAVDAITALLVVMFVGVFAWGMRGHWLDQPLALRYVLAAVGLAFLLNPHLYAQDCVLLLVFVALAFSRMHSPRVSESGGSLRAQAAVLLAVGVMMDLSAIDTYWAQGLFFRPLHLLTLLLMAGVVILVWPHARTAGARADGMVTSPKTAVES
jgi:hypothetical protein